jgi:2-octaprenyl-6-methoxyphenol hydroxylase
MVTAMAETRTGAERSDFDTDVLIVGGGLVGLSLACAVSAAGLEVTVVDREPPAEMLDPAFDGRASSIALGSARMLKAIGVWAGLGETAQPVWEIRVTEAFSTLYLHYDHRAAGGEPMGYIVENRDLRRALHRAVRSRTAIDWRAPASVADLVRDGHGASATLDDGTQVRARLLAAADGKHSALRARAGIGVFTHAYRQTGIVCTLGHERPHRGIACERFFPAGPFAILPMLGNRSSLVWTEAEELAPAMMALSEAAFLNEVASRLGDYLGALEVIGPRWSYPLMLGHARHFTAERLALLGDAAHAIHPLAGQGLNLGLRDVAALAEIVADAHRLGLDIGDGARLARYGRWRRFDTMRMALVTDGLNRLFSNDVAPLRAVRDLGLAAVNRMGPLKTFFMGHAMGTTGDLPRLMRGEPL